MNKIGILGSGSWATALAKISTENQNKINWYVRKEEFKTYFLTHQHNPKYLSQVNFDLDLVNMYTDINEFVQQTDILILATPSPYVRSILEPITVSLENKIVFIATKGIISEGLQLVSDFLHDSYGIPYEQLGTISGPCHAEEVAMENLSYLTFACLNETTSQLFKAKMQCEYIQTTTSTDLLGAELGAVIKNIYAIAGGIAHGLRFGDNFMAILMSNAIREMKKVLDVLYPTDNRDIKESAYLGDLLVTGYSTFSRNRMFGNMIGKGYTVKAAQMEMNMIAEGYYASACLRDLLQKQGISLDLPIIESIYDILYNKKRASVAFESLCEKLD